MHVAHLLQFKILFSFNVRTWTGMCNFQQSYFSYFIQNGKKTSYSNEWLLKFVKWLSVSYSKQSPNNILCWLRLIVQIFIHVFIYFRQAQELANRNSTQVENLAVSIVMIQVLKKMI